MIAFFWRIPDIGNGTVRNIKHRNYCRSVTTMPLIHRAKMAVVTLVFMSLMMCACVRVIIASYKTTVPNVPRYKKNNKNNREGGTVRTKERF